MVVSTLVHPVCQSCPAASPCWPVSAGPSSAAAEPLSGEAPVQPEKAEAPLQPSPRHEALVVGGCCL